MNRIQRAERIKQLKENGYKRVPDISYIYLNEYGKVYNLQKDKELKPNLKNLVIIENRYLNVAKLILLVFRKEPIRAKQQIRYIDGDSDNLRIENIEYTRKYKSGLKTNVNNENLYTAIRCYFNVPKKYNIKDHILTRMYLAEIIRIRDFHIDNRNKEDIDIFKSYMQGATNNCISIAKQHGISISDCKYIVYSFLNLLSDSIIKELEAEILQIKEYQPRPKTKTQELRELNEYLVSNGLKPVRLRKRSNREIINGWKKYSNNLRNNTL